MLRLAATSLAVGAIALVLMPVAVAAPPTIVSPAEGAEFPQGWTGPVEVTWQEAGEMTIEVTGPQPTETIPAMVAPEDVGVTAQYSISALNAYGEYVISAGRADGSEAPASVTVRVPPPSEAAIVAPVSGATVLYGWQGPVRIRWDSVDPESSYRVLVDASEACAYDGLDPAPGEVTSCALAFAPSVGTHGITVEEVGGEEIATSSFRVVPHLALLGLSASPYRFYPYVRDGYRDRVTVRWNLNKPARVVIKIRNSAGRTVRRVAIGFREDGSWRWNGRNNGGARVPTGRYRILFEARALGELRRASREVRVARGWRTKTASKTRCAGCGPGAWEASPGCSVQFDVIVFGDAFLDCLGGNFGIIVWRFRIPANAFNISKRIVGEVGCCRPGVVVRSGQRTGRRTYLVGAGISGFRSYWIERVRIKYSYKVRI